VSITYMNVEAADALIQWAGKLPEGNLTDPILRLSTNRCQLVFVYWNNSFQMEKATLSLEP